MAYITLSEIKLLLGIQENDDDALLIWLIEQAEAKVEGHFGRSFEAATETRYYDSERDIDEDEDLLLLDKDLASITSITNGDGDVLTTSEYVTEPANDTPYHGIRLLPSASLVWQPASNGDTENAITIVGSWGYGTSVPEDIKGLVADIVVNAYRGRESTGDLNRTIISGGLVINPAELPISSRMTLQNPAYKRSV